MLFLVSFYLLSYSRVRILSHPLFSTESAFEFWSVVFVQVMSSWVLSVLYAEFGCVLAGFVVLLACSLALCRFMLFSLLLLRWVFGDLVFDFLIESWVLIHSFELRESSELLICRVRFCFVRWCWVDWVWVCNSESLAGFCLSLFI